MSSQQYRHILYYSPSHIRQLFFDRVDEATQIQKEEESRKTQNLMAGLKMFINAQIGGKEETRKNVMKSVNHSEDHIQAKKVVNHLLQDEKIPRLKYLEYGDFHSLYRFSCEVQILPYENDGPGDSEMVEVVGREGDIKFRGITSLDNWSSLSDTLQAVNNEIPYPLEGIVQLADVHDEVLRETIDGGWELEQADCDVNFVFICQSSREEMQKWRSRRDLHEELQSRKS